jgi:integrase
VTAAIFDRLMLMMAPEFIRSILKGREPSIIDLLPGPRQRELRAMSYAQLAIISLAFRSHRGTHVTASHEPIPTHRRVPMPALSTWNLDPTRLLTRRELATILADLAAKADRFANVRRNLIIVRLACCCGLRVSEIAGLQLDDVVVDVQRPHMRLRRQITKGKRSRCVPLWWDAGTLGDILEWKQRRMKDGACGTDPFVCSVQANRRGMALQRAALRRRFLSACKVLGLARLRTLTIHHGGILLSRTLWPGEER